MNRRKSLGVIVGIAVLLVCGFWIDNSLVQNRVRNAVTKYLQQSMESVLGLSPVAMQNSVPRDDQKNVFNLVNDSNGSYRVINMNDDFIQQQMRTYALTFFEQDPTTPVCKITAITFGYAPEFENAGVTATVQYVDPLGIVQSFYVNVTEPLKHIPVKH